MVLDLPGGLFGQEDVRETATESSAVTGTLYWSCSANNFKAVNPDTDAIRYGGIWNNDEESATAEGDNIEFEAPVFLPHGAVIIACVVYGNAGAAAETWYLVRKSIDDASTSAMASANIDTEDTSVSNSQVDNNLYTYAIGTSSLDTNDAIYGARITYTL